MGYQTNKQQAASQRIKLKRIKKELEEMSSDWDDRDQYLLNVLEELAHKVDQTLAQLATDQIMTEF